MIADVGFPLRNSAAVHWFAVILLVKQDLLIRLAFHLFLPLVLSVSELLRSVLVAAIQQIAHIRVDSNYTLAPIRRMFCFLFRDIIDIFCASDGLFTLGCRYSFQVSPDQQNATIYAVGVDHMVKSVIACMNGLLISPEKRRPDLFFIPN